MKRTLFILLLLAGSITAQAQKARRFQVLSITYSANMYAYVHFDENNVATDTVYYLYGRDDRFQNILEWIELTHGTYEEVKEFAEFALTSLLKEEPGTILEHGTTIDIERIMA